MGPEPERVLLLHPSDEPLSGPWAGKRWDRVVDLGWAGGHAYDRWSRALGCPVTSVYGNGRPVEDMRLFRERLKAGRGRLVDRQGFDWWELALQPLIDAARAVLMAQRLEASLPRSAALIATRSHPLSTALARLRRSDASCFKAPGGTLPALLRWGRYLRRRSPAGVLSDALDKWDAHYVLRRRFASGGGARGGPATLLPTSYINATRTSLAYARMLPERRFLLVYTRSNGRPAVNTPNVETCALAAHAQPQCAASAERRELEAAWRSLRDEALANTEDWGLAVGMGALDFMPKFISSGLAYRDAWARLFESRPIRSVLCADESNPATWLPVLMASRAGIPTLSCNHGAFDDCLAVKGLSAGVFLAKGEIERDYLESACRIPPERIRVGAPAFELPAASRGRKIVFFSEPLEVYQGRPDEMYSDVLPRLCALSRRTGKRLVVRLHPFEMMRDRKRLARRILSKEDAGRIEWSEGEGLGEVLAEAWCSVIIQSSVALDSALAGVPAFFCGWLAQGIYGYVGQFEKFGAARRLSSPEELLNLPELLLEGAAPAKASLRAPIRAEELDRLLSGTGGA